MEKKFNFRALTRSVGLSLFLSVAAVAQTIPPPLAIGSVPVGLQPLGIDIAFPFANAPQSQLYAAVADSGDNSVSILALNLSTAQPTPKITLNTIRKVEGIPSPYAVAACPGVPLPQTNMGYVLVSSPSDNSVRALGGTNESVVGTVPVGQQPYSVTCFADINTNKLKGVVSNVGDSSLTVFDVATLGVIATIPGVPGSRAFHGIGIFRGPNGNVAWVAGTDANVITMVDLLSFKVLTQIPVARPTAIFTIAGVGGDVVVASAGNNEILAYSGLQGTPLYQNVPNPQDAVVSALGLFATIGGQDSLWQETGDFNIEPGISPNIISGIPGAAALAATSFGVSNFPPNLQIQATAVLVTSTSTNSVFLIEEQPSLPSDFRITNAASFATNQAAPGSLASAFATTGVSQAFSAKTLPLPGTLGGVALSVGGTLSFDATAGWKYSSTGATQVPLLFVGPNQVNFQIPPGIAAGNSVAAQLTKPDGTTLLTTLNVTATAPGIFTVLQNGQGQAAALNPDYSQNGNPQSIVGAKPVALGSFIQIYAIGGGDTTPTLMPGEAAPASGNPLILTNVQPTVTIGGQSAQVLFSGMAPGFVGLWQINAQIPHSVVPGNAVPLVVNAGGVASNTVTIAVQ